MQAEGGARRPAIVTPMIAAAAFAIVAMVVVGIVAIAAGSSAPTRHLMYVLGTVAEVLATVVVALRAIRAPTREGKIAWGLIAVGAASLLCADALFSEIGFVSVVQRSGSDTTPSISVSLACFVYYPTAYLGLAFLLRRRLGSRIGRRHALTGMVVGLGPATVINALLVYVVARLPQGDMLLFGLPALDVTLLALVLGTVAVTGRRVDRSTGLLLAGLVTLMLADITYGVLTATESWTGDAPSAALWPLGLLLWAIGAWVVPGPPPRERKIDRRDVMLPIGSCMLALGVIVIDRFYPVNSLALSLAIATLVTAVAFLALSLSANVSLSLRLDEARRVAEEASRARAAFLAGMSHELRTPLTEAIALSDVLESTELDEDQRACVRAIRASSISLNDAIGDLLDFSKIEAGGLQIERRRFDVHAIVRDVAASVRPRAAVKGVEVTVTIDDDVPREILGDAKRVRQIVLGLCSNAVKFTSEGTVAVAARAVGDDVEVGVSDTGIGIAPDRCDAIFRPFTQADASIGRRFGGTGLGLSIARDLALAMDGDVTVSSVPGEGSTFTLRVPRAGVPDADD